jgi:DNA-binding HxlR family transcriptional regulator
MRSYHQFCSLARALDVVGDRWSMLIVRNLLLGPQRWSELRDGLPGVATNLLAQRLVQLEADGLLCQGAAGYALTPIGAELEPALFALADWGERHWMGPPTADDAMRLRYLMTSMRRRLLPGPIHARVALWVGDQGFDVRLGPAPTVEPLANDGLGAVGRADGRAEHGILGDEGAPRDFAATVRCDGPTLQRLLFVAEPWPELRAQGLVQVDGDERAIAAWLQSWPAMRLVGEGDDVQAIEASA